MCVNGGSSSSSNCNFETLATPSSLPNTALTTLSVFLIAQVAILMASAAAQPLLLEALVTSAPSRLLTALATTLVIAAADVSLASQPASHQ